MAHVRRRSYESGHRPKFLTVVDETAECERAVHFAARRAARTAATVVMLSVVEAPDGFEWLGVGDVMRGEAETAARKRLEAAAAKVRADSGVEPELLVRTGVKVEEILKLIEDDPDISFLVLAAGTGKEGPGPLVTSVAGKTASTYPVPVVIVPGGLSDAEIDAIAG